jgi:hypothetical protein
MSRKKLISTLSWGEEDSNLRRHRQQIYSLPQLTALVSPRSPVKITLLKGLQSYRNNSNNIRTRKFLFYFFLLF